MASAQAMALELEAHPDSTLTDNLTGGQIQEVLDTLISEAVSPIIRGSDAFDLQVVHLLSATSRNRKRKLSSLPRELSIDTMCQFLVSEDREEKVRLIKAMRLERGFVYNFVVKFLSEANGYTALYQDWIATKSKRVRKTKRTRLAAMERSVGCSKDDLYQVMSTAKDYLDLAYRFRNTIVLNYLRHAHKQAKAFVNSKGPNFDFKDVIQNFLAAVTRAVDKYDASKGALTSYINWWLLNAQTTSNSAHGHEYGIAYTIPQQVKKSLTDKSKRAKQINFGISLDKMVGSSEDKQELIHFIEGEGSIEQGMIDSEEADIIRSLIKHADPKGLARLYLDIDEVFSKKEKRRMLKTMKQQLGVVPAKDQRGSVRFVKVVTRTKKSKNRKQ